MSPETHLLVHNISMGISGVVTIALAIFAYVHNRRSVTNITFALVMVSASVFIFSHIIGVSLDDPYTSRAVLMFNISIIFISVFNAHCILGLIGKARQRTFILILTYVFAAGLAIFYLMFPDTFLGPSVPKMYFANYYSPGEYHWLMRIMFNVIVPIYFLAELLYAYFKSTNREQRYRFIYLFVATVIGYGVGSIPIFLVYNIPVDPAWGSLFALFYSVPVVYAIVQYKLLDISIIAKQSFFYALAVIVTGSLLALFDLLNQLTITLYPDFPFWLTPLTLAFFAVGLGIAVWRKLREDDMMKYEFITTVTHKFRTPLTGIKWATENMMGDLSPEERRTQLRYIAKSNSKLVELTNMLVDVSETENPTYTFNIAHNNIREAADKVLSALSDRIREKNITINNTVPRDLFGYFDAYRIGFVIQTFIENALAYTPNGGTVAVSAEAKDKSIVFSVTDTGMGISQDELPLLFSKFHRNSEARLADTEGMGVGLYLSKGIISRHNGKIRAESGGKGMGSTFSFSLPQ